MAIVVGISFRRAGKIYWFDPVDLELRRGDKVVADTAEGTELGEVKAPPMEVPDEQILQPLKPLLRLADIDDIRRENENRFREQEAFRTGQEKISQYNLPMKLIGVECAFDRSRIIFHFVAESRVDFRDLARDLARTLKSRVELHQVGVKDEAKLLGGLGSCGKELCCASFLSDFEPVGIKMAKEQDLSLNPQKISGVCGRLMCCLAYEYPCYREVKTRLPKLGGKVDTERGPGRVTAIDTPREEAIVTLEEGGTVRIKAAPATTACCEECPKTKEEN
jgi:cell fate regulator YaaT (PSP1 superfamily)